MLDSKYRRKYRIAWVFKKTYLPEQSYLEKELIGYGDWFDENKAGTLKIWCISMNKEYSDIHHFIQIKKEDTITGEVKIMTFEEINTKLDTLFKEVENWKPQKINDSHQKPIKEKKPNV